MKFLKLHHFKGVFIPRVNGELDIMHTVQQDHNKSALSIATNPGHQKTEVPVEFKKLFTHHKIDKGLKKATDKPKIDHSEDEEVEGNHKSETRRELNESSKDLSYFNTFEANK